MLGGGDLMVMLVARQAHLEHGRDHLSPDVDRAVDRRDREIAAFGARPVAHVPALVDAAGVGRELDVVEVEVAAVIIVAVADVVEHEEFGFGPNVGSIGDSAGLEIGFGAGRGGARITGVKLAGGGLDNVAEQDQHRGRAERIVIDGAQVRHEDHVAFVDRLPPGDRRAVEHEAVLEHVLVDCAGGHGQMLPFSLGIGEAQVDPLDLVRLETLHDVCGAGLVGHENRVPRDGLMPEPIPAQGVKAKGRVNISRGGRGGAGAFAWLSPPVSPLRRRPAPRSAAGRPASLTRIPGEACG